MVASRASGHPRATLGRVLDDLGTTLLALVHGNATHVQEVGGVVFWDPADEPEIPAGGIVLAIGVDQPSDMAALVRHLGSTGASAVVFRAPLAEHPELIDASNDTDIALLALTRGATWGQLAAMLRALLADTDVFEGDAGNIGGVESGDLFALANAITALLDAPVTIEDRSSRLLAFSGRQDEADEPRVRAILGRQVPEEVTRTYLEKNVFRELYRSDRPVFVDPVALGLDQMPRIAIAVRAGDEVLGSIWATVSEPLSEERSAALMETAKVVALHLLRARASADVERRVRSDLVGSAVQGGVEAAEALSRLGFSGKPAVVLALEVVQATREESNLSANTSYEVERQRIGDAFRMHLTALHPRSASAPVGAVTYGILPTTREGLSAERRARQIAGEFLDRLGTRAQVVIGVGPVARTTSEFAHSRATAERVLRVLRTSVDGTRRAATLNDIHFEVLLQELQDITMARGDDVAGPLAYVLAYDAKHHTNLYETLSAWFDAFGDTKFAADVLAIHPNTLRYRLRRVSEICGVSLDDPSARLALMLQVRLLNDRAATPKLG